MKQFQYELQDYQENCVDNIVDIFECLHQKKSFVDVLSNHKNKHQYHFPIQQTKNIDIMMETGTGKTFTFIKTIFELNKNFGYNKFIILIPNVAIREGTKTNLTDTKDYFKSLYANQQNKEIEIFVYEGGSVSIIDTYVRTTNLSVLIITPSAFNSKDNILNRPLEKDIQQSLVFDEIDNKTLPISYLECLKYLNPIVIMDEPHRFEGDAFKGYFKGFNNYYLRFGATFPKPKNQKLKVDASKTETIGLSNVAYVLDSISSFRQNLVKKIVVYTQDIVENSDTLVSIQYEKTATKNSKNLAIVHSIINGNIVKQNLVVGQIFNEKAIKKINRDSIVLADDTIEKIDYSLSDDALRSMISQTIQIHFSKEQELFDKGIKALTLFFIESDVSLFRGDNPKIKRIFEEEYQQQYTTIINRLESELEDNTAYYNYLKKDFSEDKELQVHKGYFSGDKGNNDEKVKSGVDEILKDKKKLLSFESPTRFIFSIWALQEGWDNPNVFTICKLSNQGNENSKLQQIGRGLRICVNQQLQRNTLKYLNDDQEEFWRINNLDVVVSNKEQDFVQAIQKEILNNSFLLNSVGTFTEQELIHNLKEKSNFDDNTIVTLVDDVLKEYKMIVRQSIVDGQRIYKKSDDFFTILKEQQEQKNISKEEFNILENLFEHHTNQYIQDANTKKDKKKLFIKNTHLQEFQNLWNSINQNSIYVVDSINKIHEQQLVQNIKAQIETLKINEILLETKKSELHINQIQEQNAITEKIINLVSHQNKVDYLAFVRDLSTKTKTPIAFIIQIFNSLNETFRTTMLCNNPAQALKEMEKIIKDNLIAMIQTNIRYEDFNHVMTGKALSNVFSKEKQGTYLKAGTTGKFQKDITDITNNFSLKEKWIFEEVIEYDSNFELEIIEQDPNIESIEIFGKLPKLEINTPLGKYNPDFCYAIKGKEGQRVILVVESKGYDTETAIPKNEHLKIVFAEKYFNKLNEFYKEQNIKISFQKRINKTQLSVLIKDCNNQQCQE